MPSVNDNTTEITIIKFGNLKKNNFKKTQQIFFILLKKGFLTISYKNGGHRQYIYNVIYYQDLSRPTPECNTMLNENG